MKDYNSINFRNSAIDSLSGKFGKGDEPTDRKKNRLMKKADKQIKSAMEEAQAIRNAQGKSSSLENYLNSKKQ